MTATDKTHALALKLLRTLIAAATASMILLAPATQTAHAAEAEANTVAAMQPDTYASVPEAEEDNAATVLQSANAAPDKATAPTVADATAAAGTGASAGEGENADAEEASSPASASTGTDAGADTANDTVIPADTPANKTTSAPDSDRATDIPDEQTDNDAEPTMLTASSGQSESDADISGAAITVSKLTYTGSALIPRPSKEAATQERPQPKASTSPRQPPASPSQRARRLRRPASTGKSRASASAPQPSAAHSRTHPTTPT